MRWKKEKKNPATTAHLRPNMIYDLAGELHVMIERVDQGFLRSRNIAARPRIDSDADRLLHTSTLRALPLYPAATSFSLPLHHAEITGPPLSMLCGGTSFRFRFICFYCLRIQRDEIKKKNGPHSANIWGKGKDKFFFNLCHISILLFQIFGRAQQECI